MIGKSTVARVCKDTAERYAAWCERDLSSTISCTATWTRSTSSCGPTDEPAEGVLVAWGITLEGQKVLLGLQLGSPRELRVLA